MRPTLLVPVLLLVMAADADAQACSRLKPGETAECSALTTTLPTMFSRLEKIEQAWRLGANMTLGGSFIWAYGRASVASDGSYTLAPKFFTGPVLNFGVAQDTAGVEATLMPGLVLGFGSVAALFGYDVLLNRPVIGVGTQIQTLTFTNKLTKFY